MQRFLGASLSVWLAAVSAEAAEVPKDLGVGTIEDFVFAPDGKSLVVLGKVATAVVDPATLAVRARIDARVQSSRILFSYDGETVALAPCEVHLVRLKDAAPPLTLACDGEGKQQCARALIFSPVKPELWLACPDGKVTRRAARDGKVLAAAASMTTAEELAAAAEAVLKAPEARMVPAYRDGEFFGFKIFSLSEANALAQKYGMENGDVITKINGQPLTKPDEALTLYQQLAKVNGPFEIEVSRRGKPVVLKVTPDAPPKK